VPGEGAFDYTAKYLLKSTQEICPGRFSPEFTTESCKAHRALSCAGYSRTDFIVSAKGPIYLHPARCCSQATRYANLETKGGAELLVMSDTALFAAGSHDQAHAQREIAPYKWVHPDDDERR
jgi:hypothetical protein